MPEDVIVRQGAPTLAGIKTGSLFCCPVAQGEDVAESVREMNARLVPRGARMIPLRRTEESVLLYVYRPRMLRDDLQNALAAKLLTERVYPVESSEKCVAELARHYEHSDDRDRARRYLRLAGDLPFAEIGAILGESETWARVTFYRVKEKLKEGGGSGC